MIFGGGGGGGAMLGEFIWTRGSQVRSEDATITIFVTITPATSRYLALPTCPDKLLDSPFLLDMAKKWSNHPNVHIAMSATAASPLIPFQGILAGLSYPVLRMFKKPSCVNLRLGSQVDRPSQGLQRVDQQRLQLHLPPVAGRRVTSPVHVSGM